MTTVAKFKKTILSGSGKQGIIKPNDKGYYLVTLGAFNAFNQAGIGYPFNAYLKREFTANSALQNRLANGDVRSEVEHPEMLPGMRLAEYLNRLRVINRKYECGHISEVRLVESKDHEGRAIIRVDGLIRPSGIHKNVLKESLENREEGTCFSVRSIVRQSRTLTSVTNDIQSLVTWDLVNEPGMAGARKFLSPGIESFDDGLEVTPELLYEADVIQSSQVGIESTGLISTTMIRDDLGWNKVQLITPNSVLEW